jgi:hypothetical protein
VTEDRYVEISGRDLRQLPKADVHRASPKPPQSTPLGRSLLLAERQPYAPEQPPAPRMLGRPVQQTGPLICYKEFTSCIR